MPDPAPSPTGASRRPEASFGGPVAGRLPPAATIAGVLSLALAVAVLGGRDLLLPETSQTATPPTSVVAPSSASSVEPSPLSTKDCDLLDPDGSFPAYRLVTGGFGGTASALFGRVQHSVLNTAPEAWLVPAAPRALEAELGSQLRLRSADESCLAAVTAEYAAVGTGTPEAGDRTPLRTAGVEWPSAEVPFEPLPEGDWVVHVIARPFTSTNPVESTAYAELFFRVIVGPPATPRPSPTLTPVATPAVPCGAADGRPPGAYLIVDQAAPIPGERGVNRWPQQPTAPLDDNGAGSLVMVPPGAPVTLAIEGERCALAWTIQLAGAEFGQNLAQQSNPTLDPAHAAQNQFPLSLSSFIGRDDTLSATLEFAEGELVFRWHVIAAPIELPDLRLIDVATGADAATLPGCPFGWYAADGTGGDTSCATTHPGVPLHLLLTTAGAALRLEADGWTITPQRADCGSFVADSGGGPELFVSDPACGRIPLYGDAPTVSLFAPPAGVWTLEFWLSLESGYVSLSAPWYVIVNVP